MTDIRVVLCEWDGNAEACLGKTVTMFYASDVPRVGEFVRVFSEAQMEGKTWEVVRVEWRVVKEQYGPCCTAYLAVRAP